MFFHSDRPQLWGGLFSVACGLLILCFLKFYYYQPIDANDLAKAIASDRFRTRISALRNIYNADIEIGEYPQRVKMIDSDYIPERYWLALTLGKSRMPRTYDELMLLINDPDFNVVYMAIRGLGLRGERKAVKEILHYMESSENWYVQLYAYKSLRKLGWKQTKSK